MGSEAWIICKVWAIARSIVVGGLVRLGAWIILLKFLWRVIFIVYWRFIE